MATTWPSKDPDEVLDYRVDWTDRLAGDTIANSTFTLATAAGLTIDSDEHAASTATIWLSGGTPGLTATIRNLITTTGGRTLDDEITLAINSGLVVEDGSGLADAGAMASVADADAYCAARGLAWSGRKADKEGALIRGADRLVTYGFKGAKTAGRAQAMPFPRIGCTDRDGAFIESDEVPVEIIHANIELAVFELANPGGLTPAVVLSEKVKRLREKVGPIETETEFAATSTTVDQSRPVLTRVDDLIGGLVAGTSNSLVGTAVRS